jgi:acyl carrier protein
MPSSSEIEDFINDWAQHQGISAADITPTRSFKEDLGCDDLTMEDLLHQAEEKFGISSLDRTNWRTPQDVINDVLSHS